MGPRYELLAATTALLVIDMTNDLVVDGRAGQIPSGQEIVEPLSALVEACHEAGAPVIFISHVLRPDGCDVGRMADTLENLVDYSGMPLALRSGSFGVQFIDELEPQLDDIILEKHRASAFFERELDSILRGLRISTVLITGVSTNGCCLATALDAAFRGYRVVFVSDATAAAELADVGFGAFSADECQRMTLTTVAAAVGEVATTDEVVDRLQQRRTMFSRISGADLRAVPPPEFGLSG
jgi:ureidoacrylate peracid hydrolase